MIYEMLIIYKRVFFVPGSCRNGATIIFTEGLRGVLGKRTTEWCGRNTEVKNKGYYSGKDLEDNYGYMDIWNIMDINEVKNIHRGNRFI